MSDMAKEKELVFQRSSSAGRRAVPELRRWWVHCDIDD